MAPCHIIKCIHVKHIAAKSNCERRILIQSIFDILRNRIHIHDLESLASLCSFDFMMAVRSKTLFRHMLWASYSTYQIARFVNYYCYGKCNRIFYFDSRTENIVYLDAFQVKASFFLCSGCESKVKETRIRVQRRLGSSNRYVHSNAIYFVKVAASFYTFLWLSLAKQNQWLRCSGVIVQLCSQRIQADRVRSYVEPHHLSVMTRGHGLT